MNRLVFINIICLGICFFVAVKGKTAVVDPKTQPVYVKEGDALKLTCVEDMGQNVEWLKDGKKIDTGTGNDFFTTQKIVNGKVQSVLMKNIATKADKDVYTCQPMGEPDKGYNVEVFVITVTTTNGIAETHKQDVFLGCSAGLNSYETSWYHNGKKIDENAEKYTTYDNHTLLIIDTVENDEGEYICKIELNNNSTYDVPVYLNMKPQVHTFQKSKNIIQGDPLQLECKAYGYPEFTVTWYKDDTPIEELDESILERIKVSNATSEYEKVIVNGTLRMENLDYDDRAEYTCLAHNEHGSNNATILVRVKDKLAALWPFLGICAEVAVLCAIIFVYEKRRAKKMEEEERREEADHLTNSHAHRGNDDIRQRK